MNREEVKERLIKAMDAHDFRAIRQIATEVGADVFKEVSSEIFREKKD